MSEFDGMLEHSQWLRPLARGLIGDEHLAEDAVQETWIAAWRRPPRDQKARPAWLRQVVRNIVHMQFRGDGRRRQRERLASRSEVQRDELPLEALELRRAVVRAVMALDEPFQSTLILRFYEDLSSAEIARLEGIPASTVRVRLKRGLERLREQLDDNRENFTASLFLIAGIELPGETAESTSLSGLVAASRLPDRSWRRRLQTAATWILCGAVAVFILWFFGGAKVSDPVAASRGSGSGGGARGRRALWLPRSAPAVTDSGDSASSVSETVPGATVIRPLAPGLVGRQRWTELRVVDGLGQPVADARVSSGQRRLQIEQIAAGYASAFEFLVFEPSPDLLGHTAADGKLRVSSEMLRGASLAVSADHFLTTRESPIHRRLVDGIYNITLEPSLRTEITVEAESGIGSISDCAITVTGRGFRADYLPVPDSPVTHSSQDDVELVSFEAPGFAAVQNLLSSPRHHQRLSSGRTARGTVVDSDGRPIVGATVAMRSTLWRGPAYTVRTDALGRFATFGLADSGELELEVSHGRYPRRTSSHDLPCHELGDLVVARPHRLRGRILAPDGSPCKDALILALPTGKFLSRNLVRSRSDADGTFEFSALPAGNYVLRAEHPHFAPAERSARTPDFAPVTLRLGLGGAIWGRVQTRDGNPVAGVPIRIGTIVGDELRGPIVHSGPDGRFLVEHLPRGTVHHRPRRPVVRWSALDEANDTSLVAELFLPYQLISANGVAIPQPAHFGSRNTVAVAVDTELRLVIADPTPQSPVEFQLTDQDGVRLRAFSNVLIVSPDDWTMKDFAGVDGQPYHLPNPSVLDRAQLTVMSRGYCWQTVRVDLRGEAGRIRFALSPTFDRPPMLQVDATEPMQLLVAPLLPGVEPLAGLPIGATDSHGRLELTHLGPGRYALCVPRDPDSLFGKSGKRRLAMGMDELHTVGYFTLSSIEGQIVPVPLRATEQQEDSR